MSWLKTICSTQDDADRYFDIGHGDFHEEFGLEPDYVVWALIGGRIETGNTIHVDADGRHSGVGGTHGILWGHNITDLTYKGRYEPETGRLSIVSPEVHEF
jgi:hypothetical protein